MSVYETRDFIPEQDCSTDESVGGDPEGRCALVPEEQCTLRCHIRWQAGEPQVNDDVADAAEKTR